jgi:formylglycine-generating enzyme required for sulfatase activity
VRIALVVLLASVPAAADPAMAKIPGARFRMGARDGRPDERPVHVVQVAPFEIDLTEVTVSAYAECVAAGQCSLPDNQVPECDWGHHGLERHPIACVNWDQAIQFCTFAGKRLPSEAEWELAARGTDGRRYPYGAGASGGEECEITSADRPTCEVASAPRGRSPFGVFDMTGNVDEWTASTYCPYDRPGCHDRRKVTRGGSSDFIGGTATSRTALDPHTIGPALGFRCAR